MRADEDPELTADLLLRAYASGIFPMAETRDDPDLFWVDPPLRGVIPLDQFHISRSLRRRMRGGTLSATLDADFSGVLAGCADRAETWINPTIERLMLELHVLGYAHSVEIWQDGALAGGVYGIALGGAFFGESMFSRRTDASKTALAVLVDQLRAAGFTLLDTQFLTDHLASLGAEEIRRKTYRNRLEQALQTPARFPAPGPVDLHSVLQRSIQTS